MDNGDPQAAPVSATQTPSHRRHWFPVAFATDLVPGELTRVTVMGTGYVLFHGENGELRCLPDRCPHRSARLSDGRWTEGRVECLYHGWTFEGSGRCTTIPQLPEGGTIPDRACLDPIPLGVVDGMVWLWGGESKDADLDAIRRVPGISGSGVHVIDYATDLPYAQELLVENVLDFAHIHIAHDGARGGGHRAHAGPLAFDIDDRGVDGFLATFKSPAAEGGANHPKASGATVEFEAPNLVHYISTFEEGARVSGLALYSVPLAHDRCRLLYRAYSNFWPERDLRRPRWREHIHQMELLEQDMAVVMGQAETLRADTQQLREAWLPVKSSDQLVVLYRRWIDAHALDSPGTMGWGSRNGTALPPSHDLAVDRASLHTRHCSDCRRALRRLEAERTRWALVAFVMILAAACAPGLLVPVLVASAGLVSAALAARAHGFSQRLIQMPAGDHLPPGGLRGFPKSGK